MFCHELLQNLRVIREAEVVCESLLLCFVFRFNFEKILSASALEVGSDRIFRANSDNVLKLESLGFAVK